MKANFRKFLLLWSGEFVSSIGGGLTGFGLGVYIFNMTGSAAGVIYILISMIRGEATLIQICIRMQTGSIKSFRPKRSKNYRGRYSDKFLCQLFSDWVLLLSQASVTIRRLVGTNHRALSQTKLKSREDKSWKPF